ncbi:MAG TPA: alpha/beta hydrolase [Candidatus Saccharimonadales bacterium]|nr:alpha/beta hydrolase [Candidatus Saccharimonadales bacterium]
MSPLFTLKQLPLTRHLTSIDGLRTAHWEGGTVGAPPIILLHGLNGSHHGLWPLATRLSDYHLFLPDMPGHGSSALPKKARVAGVVQWFDAYMTRIAALTGQPPVVIAHSFGAQIAFMACQQKPEAYRDCILLTPVPRVSILPYLFGKSLALLPSRLALEVVGRNESLRFWRGSFLLHRHTPETRALVRWIGDQGANSPDKFAFYVSISQELMGTPSYSRAGVTKGRFYCVAGDNDRMLTPASLAELRTMFGKKHFAICKNTGHLMPIEAPDETAALLRTMLPPTSTD